MRVIELRPIAVAVAVAALAAVAGCADLPPPGTCGNGVHEPEAGEDCDGDSATCAECRLLCSSDAPCPDGYACGVGGVCSQPSGAFAYPATIVDYAPQSFAVIDIDGDSIGDVLGIADDHADLRFGSAIADLGRSFRQDTPRLTPWAPIGITATGDPAFPAAAVLPTPEGISVNVIRSELLLPLPTPALTSIVADFRDAQIACNPTGCGIAALGVRAGELVLVLDDSELPSPCGAVAADASGTFFQVVQSQMNDRDMIVVSTPSTGACLYAVEGDFTAGEARLATSAVLPTATGGRGLLAVERDTDPCEEVYVLEDAGYHVLDVNGCTGPGLLAEVFPSAFYRPIAAGDLDGTPNEDRVTADHIEFAGATRFDFPPGMVLTAAAIVDLNNDGRNDVVGIDQFSGLRVLIGVGDQEFQLREHEPGLALASISGADLDGDTYGDVVASSLGSELVVMFGGPTGLGPAQVFGFVTDPAPIRASSRTVAAQLRADVLAFQPEPGGQAVVDFRAGQNRALAPITPQPFGVVLGTMIAPIVDGAPAGQVDVGVFGLDLGGALQALIVPDAGALFVTGDPYLVDVVTPPDFFTEVFAIGLERIELGGRPVVVATARRDRRDARHALIVQLPGAGGTNDSLATVELVPPAADSCRSRSVVHLRRIQLDADADDELGVVSVEQCSSEAACFACVDEPDLLVHLVDLDAAGVPTGPPIHLTDPARHAVPAGARLGCADVGSIELGTVGPAAARDELVASCFVTIGDGAEAVTVSVLLRFFGRIDPDSGALDIETSEEPVNLPYPGRLAIGDVTGDGLDDVVIHHPEGKLGVAVQCPRHATEECQ